MGRLLLMFFVLAPLLTGCLVSARSGAGGAVVAEPGPPPHAKAWGWRAKHQYRYYPSARVYFDTGRGVWFYLDSRGNWTMTADLPVSVRARLGESVTLELDTETPWVYEEEHRRGKKKDKGWKKK